MRLNAAGVSSPRPQLVGGRLDSHAFRIGKPHFFLNPQEVARTPERYFLDQSPPNKKDMSCFQIHCEPRGPFGWDQIHPVSTRQGSQTQFKADANTGPGKNQASWSAKRKLQKAQKRGHVFEKLRVRIEPNLPNFNGLYGPLWFPRETPSGSMGWAPEKTKRLAR